MVMRTNVKAKRLADALSDAQWVPFRPPTDRKTKPGTNRKCRKRRVNLRRKRALERKKRDLLLQGQWAASVPYQPSRSKNTYRLCIRRQLILETDRQGDLFESAP